MASDLRAETNTLHRLFDKFLEESKALAIAGISLCISVIFAIMASIAIRDANQAQATAKTWQEMYKETERECRLAQNDIDDFRIALFKAGIELEHTGETD